MKIIGLDPDSHSCGWAAYEIGDKSRYVGCGVFKSKRTDPAHFRAMTISDEVESLCRRIDPDWVVIETPGKVPGRKTSVPSLQTQSIGVGAVVRAVGCGMADLNRVVLIPAHEWTGSKSKEARARMHTTETGYVGSAGMHDVDARCLAAWWSREMVARGVA